MEKCFAYLRVSDTSQVKGDGFVRQEKAITQYARAHNLKVVRWFREDFTGTEAERPQLTQLMISLELNGHGIKTVIIEKLDRLARDLMIQESIIGTFQKKGFDLISAIEGPELLAGDPTRKFIRQVLGAVAELDKSLLVAKLRAARERKKAKGGKGDGRSSYWDKDNSEGRALIKRIQLLRRKPKLGHRRTLQQIADILNAEGTLTMDKKQWSLYSVQQILKPRKPKKS
jgi:DNA invertase Pin-like site-specific DNA recombinase